VKVDTPHSDPARGGAFSQSGAKEKEFEMRRIFSFILAASLLFAPSVALAQNTSNPTSSDLVRSSGRCQRQRHARARSASSRSSMASVSGITPGAASPGDQPNDRCDDQCLCRRDHAVFGGGLGNGRVVHRHDSKVRATDTIVLSVKSGPNLYVTSRDGGGGRILPGSRFSQRAGQRPMRLLSISPWSVRPRRN
jgi:hypothetical protein